MTLFDGEPRPRVFAVLPGADFAAALAEGLARRLGDAPREAIARVGILVNARRASRAVEDAFAARAAGPGRGTLLPRIGILTALADDPLAGPDLAPAICRLRRQLRLTRLVERYLSAAPGRAPAAAAAELAESLAGLLDELDEEGVAPERLDGLVEGEIARHWQEALAFADIVRVSWPAVRAELEGGALDPAARRRAAIGALVARWTETPPGHPVIAAASTGSRAPNAALMAAIAAMPEGAVVLPGFDPGIAPEEWRAVGPDHPYGPFRRLLDALGLAPPDIRPWLPQAPTARLRLLGQALRPAPVTDGWVAAAPALRAEAAEATAGLALIEAETPREEAAAIALAIRREIATPGSRVALVTRDASLARRVTAELSRFRIQPDDSLGRPLAESPAAVFLRLVGEVAERGAAPVALAALLQHPLTAPGLAREDHLRLARRYERAVLRGRADPTLPPGRLPPWPEAPEDGAAWLARIEGALAPLAGALTEGASLARIAAAHAEAAAELSTPGPEAPAGFRQGRDGEALAARLAEVAAAADAHGEEPVASYGALLVALMRGETLRPEAAQPHPRVMIWGTIEARVQAADLVILGGLNEGTWPATPSPDPWLSRPMREALGLPLPERETGLAAHDFLQAAARPRAILSRSKKSGGAPTVAARWLIRLENLLSGVDADALAAMRARGRELLDLVPLIHRPAPGETLPPAHRPAPTPPVEARPRRLSVTRVERLIRDAYAVYAETVLGLAPMEPLGREPDFLERGTVIHAIVHRYVAETPPDWPGEAAERDRLLSIAREVLAREIPFPATRRTWLGRLARVADWFVAGERERRQAGEPLALEVKGRMVIPLPAGPFTLSARADRIDRREGGAVIYDYKAGHPPGHGEIGLFAQQLHLQALILKAGGFEGIEALDTVGGAYLGLTGSGDGGVERAPKEAIADGLAAHRERFLALLAAYDDPATPYLSRGRVRSEREEGDYDHLARRGEWEANADAPSGEGRGQ